MVGSLKVLVACSDRESQQLLFALLSSCGLEPVFSSTLQEARAILSRQVIPLVVCAADLADGSFREMLRTREVAELKIPVVVASRRDDAAEYMEAMQLGAFDFIARPYRQSELQWIVSNALRKKRAVAA